MNHIMRTPGCSGDPGKLGSTNSAALSWLVYCCRWIKVGVGSARKRIDSSFPRISCAIGHRVLKRLRAGAKVELVVT